MVFEYSGDPTTNKKDEVRFLIGDTDVQEPLLQDGEIQYLLSKYNQNAMSAAIQACETIAAKFSRLMDEQVGQVKITYSQRAEQYTKMRDELRTRLSLDGVSPYSGGISKTDKQVQEQNTDRVKPDFTKHQMENEQLAPWVTENQIGIRGSDEP